MPAVSAGLPAVLPVAGAGSSLDHAVWFAARSTGLVAYALATAAAPAPVEKGIAHWKSEN